MSETLKLAYTHYSRKEFIFNNFGADGCEKQPNQQDFLLNTKCPWKLAPSKKGLATSNPKFCREAHRNLKS